MADLHTGKLYLTIPDLQTMTDERFYQEFGIPRCDAIKRKDGDPLGLDVPEYRVAPAEHELNTPSSSHSIKIVDFGGAFLNTKPPRTLETPLAVRAPEIVFGDVLDHRVDMWSMGCLVIMASYIYCTYG